MSDEHSQEMCSTRKLLSRNLILLLNSFTWYFMVVQAKNSVLHSFVGKQAFLIDVGYFFALIVFSIGGAIFSSKMQRSRFLSIWVLLGFFASLLTIILTYNIAFEGVFISFFLLGATFGLGMPSCLAFFADHVAIENRGRTGGLLFFVISLSIIPLGILLDVLDLATTLAVLAMWRLSGWFVFALLRPNEENVSTVNMKPVPLLSIFRARSFLLYFIPWFIFSLLDSFEGMIIRHFLEEVAEVVPYGSILTIEMVASAFFVLIAGLFADWIGRKRVVIYGFVTLGLAYAVIGIAQYSAFSWYFYSFVDGAAAGIFLVAFVLLLWGDQCPTSSREKCYAIGNIPFFATKIIGIPITPYITNLIPTISFSLASFFLFIAVLPLMYAPETLPEKKIELRQLRKYVEKAKKTREEYEEKKVED